MSDARPSFFDFDMTKLFADFRMRPFDVEAMWAMQRRNIEALTHANQLAVEGIHAVAKRQMEIAQQTFEELSTMMRDVVQPVSTEARIAKQTDYAKTAIDKGMTHGREIATMAAKTGGDVVEVLHKRTAESLDEMHGFACKTAGVAADPTMAAAAE